MNDQFKQDKNQELLAKNWTTEKFQMPNKGLEQNVVNKFTATMLKTEEDNNMKLLRRALPPEPRKELNPPSLKHKLMLSASHQSQPLNLSYTKTA